MAKKKKEEDLMAKDLAILPSPDERMYLPEGMSKRQAIKWLIRLEEEDEREVAVHAEFLCWPLEGAFALYRALKHKYGFVSLASTPGFFGDNPPVMVEVPISEKETVQVPWGSIQVPNVEGRLETGGNRNTKGQFYFVLRGSVKRKDEHVVNELVALMKKFLKEESIYRGKAIRVEFPNNPDNVDFTYLPKFMDLEGVNPEELIFPEEVRRQVEVSLFTPIENTGVCREHGVPLKRGVLLEGPYGTGKTLCAKVTAQKCVNNDWTFILLEKTTDLAQAIQLARQYQPCVVFAEDIDRAVEGERSLDMDTILNTIDGIDAKNTEVLVVLTTNHVENLNRAMLRPGRLDDIIPVRPPDASAAIKLVEMYSRGLIRAGENLKKVGAALSGMIPAVIRETVERAKMAAIRHLKPGDVMVLEAQDFLDAAYSMRQQLELMKTPVDVKLSDREKAAVIVGQHINAALSGWSLPRPANGELTSETVEHLVTNN